MLRHSATKPNHCSSAALETASNFPTSSWPSAKQEEVFSIEVEALVRVHHSNVAAEAEGIINHKNYTQHEPVCPVAPGDKQHSPGA